MIQATPTTTADPISGLGIAAYIVLVIAIIWFLYEIYQKHQRAKSDEQIDE